MIRAGEFGDGSDPSSGRDAFTMLAKANEDEGTKLSLSGGELVNGPFLSNGAWSSNFNRLGMSSRFCLRDTVLIFAYSAVHNGLTFPTETSAHTLAATLADVSIHPDIQQQIVDQILLIVGIDRVPVSPPPMCLRLNWTHCNHFHVIRNSRSFLSWIKFSQFSWKPCAYTVRLYLLNPKKSLWCSCC